MARVVKYGYEEIYDEEGNLKGINFGYNAFSEHERGYNGNELLKNKKSNIFDKLRVGTDYKNPFYEEKIKESSYIKLLQGSNGRKLLTSEKTTNEIAQEWMFGKIITSEWFTKEQVDQIMESIKNSPDKNSISYYSKEHEEKQFPFEASWNENEFFIMSTDEKTDKMLEELYDNIEKGNIAISGNFETLFKNHGLSMVYLNRLTKEDLENKERMDLYNKELIKAQQEYSDYLRESKLSLFASRGNTFPFHIFNLQINSIDYDKGKKEPIFYAEVYDNLNREKLSDDGIFRNVCGFLSDSRYLSGTEIKRLVELAKDEEFQEFAANHSHDEIEEYILKVLGRDLQNEETFNKKR